MIPAPVLDCVRQRLGDLIDATPVTGGDISTSFKIEAGDGRRAFLKLDPSADQLASEADGLAALRGAGAVRVPAVLEHGTAGDTAWLLLEYLDLGGPRDAGAARLGTALAAQHRCTARHYGWGADNYIGRSLQPNGEFTDWVDFLRRQRIGHQLELVTADGYSQLHARGQQLLERLPEFFENHVPAPSLLHGDLWGGNFGVLPDGSPVIYDPAVYYGDREADIAMTRLFGGFPAAFYTAYAEAWPLDAGCRRRCDLYNLYHVLNHLHLFGSAYLAQASALLDTLLAAEGNAIT